MINLNFVSISIATFYLVFKLCFSLNIAKIIKLQLKLDNYSSLIAGWLLVQILQYAIIFTLSFFELMNHTYFKIVVVLLFIYIAIKSKNYLPLLKINIEPKVKFWLYIALVLIAIMWLRAIFLFDFTWDAQTYEIPRILLWIQNRSVFISMPTPQLNIFVNEWNSELNALAYELVSNNYLGMSFGNLEIFIVTMVVIVWILKLFKVSNYYAILLSIVLSSAPVIIGLATTVKGDLLAITSYLIAFGWLFLAIQKKSTTAIIFFYISICLSLGSKITNILPLLAIFLIALIYFKKQYINKSIYLKLLLLVGCITFLMRFILNLIIYNNPLKRISVESTNFNITNIYENTSLIINKIFILHNENEMWALSANEGASIYFLFFTLLIIVIQSRVLFYRQLILVFKKTNIKSKNNWLIIFLIILVLSLIITTGLTQAYPWSFRYFTPGITLIAVIFIAITYRYLQIYKNFCLSISSLALLTIVINIYLILKPGEIFPTGNINSLINEIKSSDTSLKRVHLFVKGPYQNSAVEILKLDEYKSSKILIFNDVDTSITPFFGSKAQNKVSLVDSIDDLLKNSSDKEWDAIVVSQLGLRRKKDIKFEIEKSGYSVLVDNNFYIIGIPQKKVSLKLKYTLNTLTWTSWNLPDQIKVNDNSMPRIISNKLIDGALNTQNLDIKNPILIRASFIGNVSSPSGHAAHISYFGVKPIILLPGHNYSSDQLYQQLIEPPPSGNARISFGLGGWSLGEGDIKLNKLEIFDVILK
jgi:hypothetical protein